MMEEKQGHMHPLSDAISHLITIASGMGFEVAEGPIIEDQRHNFDALNVPRDHPARDAQDTFFIQTRRGRGLNADSRGQDVQGNAGYDDALVLRTHTSSVQVRYMEKHPPAPGRPVRILVPGLCYRNEATDATHEAQFFQWEGLVVEEKGNITLAHLKGTLEHFFSAFYGHDVPVRFRPGYFPFVEPGVEVDMQITKKDGTKSWLEMLGAGMVHPNVLRAVDVDPECYGGFAWGGGIERLLMVKYGIDDVRQFHTGDLRVVTQF